MKKYFSVVLIIAMIAGLSACSVKVEQTVEVTETSVVQVTDQAGETVTDAQGEIATEVITIPVTEVVTDKEGETVTKKDGTPVTEAVTEIITKAVVNNDKNDKNEKNGKEARSTTNWKDRYKNTTNATTPDGSTVNVDSNTSANQGSTEAGTETSLPANAEAIEQVDQEALNIPFNQSVDLGGNTSGYKGGDYTNELKKIISGNNYTMAVILDFNGLEGVDMKDATLVAYVKGDKKAYHYTADLSIVQDEINEEDLKDMTDVSGLDMSALFKNLKELQIHMIMKNNKFYMVFPQLNIYMEMPQSEVDELMSDQLDTIMLDGQFIESKNVNGMVRESYKTEDGSIVHYYYQVTNGKAMFSRIDVETDGKTDTILKVKSITKGVNKLLVFEEPFFTQLKIDASALG